MGEAIVFAEGSVYSPALEDEGMRVLVMRTWPRGVGIERIDVWLKELGPLPELLRGLESRRLSWLAFADAYTRQIETRRESVAEITTLRDLECRAGKVTLFCHERLPPCHRFLLLEWLNRSTP